MLILSVFVWSSPASRLGVSLRTEKQDRENPEVARHEQLYQLTNTYTGRTGYGAQQSRLG